MQAPESPNTFMSSKSNALADWCHALAGVSEDLDIAGLARARTDAGDAGATLSQVAKAGHLDRSYWTALARMGSDVGGDSLTAFGAGVLVLLLKLGAGADIPLGVLREAGPQLLRIGDTEGATFRQVIASVRDAEVKALQLGSPPFEDLVQAVNSFRGTSGRPLFRVGVASRADVSMRKEGQAVWFELHIQASDANDSADGEFCLLYSPTILDPAVANRWCERLEHLLAMLLERPDDPVGSVSALLPAEDSALLAMGEGPKTEPAAASIIEWFEHAVVAWPNELAVRQHGHSISFAELNAQADILADKLISLGVKPEAIVGVLLPRSISWVITFVAILKASGVYLPLDATLPTSRISMMLQDAEPTVVVHDGGSTHDWKGLVLRFDSRPMPRSSNSTTNTPRHRESVQRHGDSAVYMLYTSGSTGKPKGAKITDRGLVNFLTWHLPIAHLAPGRVVAQFTSPGFDISVQELLAALLSGATLNIPADEVRENPHALAAWLDDQQVTDFYAPNLILELVSRAALEQGRSLPYLENISQSGEALAPGNSLREFFRQNPKRRLHNLYGPVETHGLAACVLPAEVSRWPDPVPIGRPINRTRIYVLDSQLKLVPIGVTGELYATSDCLGRGYHNRPALTAERFLPNPFGEADSRIYRTGDLARWSLDGELEYRGRADDQIKIRGMRFELGEIEAVASRAESVRDVVTKVTGADDRRRLDAYLVLHPNADPSVAIAQVRDLFSSSLPAAFIPSTVSVIAQIPLNVNGKVDRSALPSPLIDREGYRNSPTTEVESDLASIFAEVLGVPDIDVDEDFFELGGNSLLAAAVAVRIRAKFGSEVALGDIFANPSVAQMAEWLPRANPAETDGSGGLYADRPPASFAQRGLWILSQIEVDSANYNETVLLRLIGELDQAALRAAYMDVVARHEPLHTVLYFADGDLWQDVRRDMRPEFDAISVGPGQLDSVLARAARRMFRLERDLPIRGLLCRIGKVDHALLIVAHHTAFDGGSVEPLIRDLASAYNARSRGRTPDWPPLQMTYGEFAAWQRGHFEAKSQTQRAKRQSAYWAKVLDGVPPALPLPWGRPRPSTRDGAASQIDLRVPADVHEGLVQIARSTRATTFMVIHAALAGLLSELGCGSDVTLGAVASIREDDRFAPLVGHFVNTLALRVDTAGAAACNKQSFMHLLRRVREVDLEALSHRQIPFERVVEIVNPPRSTSFQPIVQVMFAYQAQDAEHAPMDGLAVSRQAFHVAAAKFDLCLRLSEAFSATGGPSGITGALEYATDVFDDHDGASIAQALEARLRSVASFVRDTPQESLSSSPESWS
jgi:amino acid adenylation domain-containing protein